VREAGLPANYPNDVTFRTTATRDRAFAHPDSVSRRALYSKGRARHLVADIRAASSNHQIYLEPILFAHAAAIPRLRILSRTRVVDLRAKRNPAWWQTAENLNTGDVSEISAAYPVRAVTAAHSEVLSQDGRQIQVATRW